MGGGGKLILRMIFHLMPTENLRIPPKKSGWRCNALTTDHPQRFAEVRVSDTYWHPKCLLYDPSIIFEVPI